MAISNENSTSTFTASHRQINEDEFDALVGIVNGLDSAFSGDISAIDARLTTAESDILAVDQRVTDLLDTAPEALDTLNELAAALGDDANFAGTVTTQLADRYTKAETDALNTTQDTATSGIDGRLTTAEGTLSGAVTDIGTNAADISTAEGNITSLDGRLTTAEGSLSTAQGDITTNAGDITSIDGRLTTAEGTISSNTTAIGTKQNIISAGNGIDITGTTVTNSAPDQIITLTQAGATSVTGTYPNFTISSTDTNTNTTYTAGTGLSLSGTEFSNTITDNNQLTNGAGYITGYTETDTLDSVVGRGATTAATVQVGTLRATADVVAYYSSDARLKNSVFPICNAVDKVKCLGGYSFYWNDKQDNFKGKDYGVIAQEVEAVFPELVDTRENGYKAVKYQNLVAVLIEAVKELSDRIETLENK